MSDRVTGYRQAELVEAKPSLNLRLCEADHVGFKKSLGQGRASKEQSDEATTGKTLSQ